ncbi:MAG: type II toxin-antitoxin system HicA family toxin [Acidimicrobiales bacterium]
MKVRELRRRLAQLGCVELRQSGAHLVVRFGRCQTVIPVHTGDLPAGTLAAIVRDLAPCLGDGWLERGGARNA